MTKILLVEDHEELWDFLSRRLRRRGFDVVLAHDGQQGVDMARAERPDVILMDMNLPVMDGWTAARTLRADPDDRAHPHHRADRPRDVGRPGPDAGGGLQRLPPQARRLPAASHSNRGRHA